MTARAALHTKTAPVSTTPDASRPVHRRRIPDTTLSVYPLALGGSVFGWTADGDTSMRILDRHAELGGNFIDTADSYAGGRSEVLVGNWLRTRRAREDTVIATKVGRNFDHPGLTPRSLIGAVHASLERLQTDYIDLLYFHFDDPAVPLEESLGAIDVLLRSGSVRYIGASNFSAERLMEARVLTANGLPRFVASQSLYNLLHREPFESSVGVVTRAQGMAVFPHSALAHGFLTGKYHGRADVTKTARGASASAYLNRKSLRTLAVVERVATEHGEEPATIALAWLLARRGVVAPAASASHPDQVPSLMAAARIRLTRGDMVDLDRATGQVT